VDILTLTRTQVLACTDPIQLSAWYAEHIERWVWIKTTTSPWDHDNTTCYRRLVHPDAASDNELATEDDANLLLWPGHWYCGPNYAGDASLTNRIEECVISTEKRQKYIDELYRITGARSIDMLEHLYEYLWAFTHASPMNRIKAALIVLLDLN
jgi:hypothetical protein